MDDRDQIIRKQNELLDRWKASCLQMQAAIHNTINLARRDETLDLIDICYIITIHQMNDLRRVVGLEPAT